jgi:hypothetical protein
MVFEKLKKEKIIKKKTKRKTEKKLSRKSGLTMQSLSETQVFEIRKIRAKYYRNSGLMKTRICDWLRF